MFLRNLGYEEDNNYITYYHFFRLFIVCPEMDTDEGQQPILH